MKNSNGIMNKKLMFLFFLTINCSLAQEIFEEKLKCTLVDTVSYEEAIVITFEDSLGEVLFFYLSNTDYYKYADSLGLRLLKDSLFYRVTYKEICKPKELRVKNFREDVGVLYDDIEVYDPKKGIMVSLYSPLKIELYKP